MEFEFETCFRLIKNVKVPKRQVNTGNRNLIEVMN